MKNNVLKELTEAAKGNNLRFYFYTKDKRLFRPKMTEAFFEKLIKGQMKALVDIIQGFNSVEPFDLDGNLDNEISYINLESHPISDFDLLKSKLKDDDYENLTEDMIEKFYNKVQAVVAVINEDLILIKKFSYPKKLLKNSIFRFKKYPLEQVEDEIFSIDNRVDVFEINNKMYILSNYFFECIFSMEQEYHKKIDESKGLIKNSTLLDNDDKFLEDCLKNKRTTKKLLKLIHKNNFSKVKSEMGIVEEVIEEYDLKIKINDGKIDYNEGDSIVQILDLIGDNYYMSTILKEKRLSQKNKTA